MAEHVRKFTLEKETKGTFRFSEVEEEGQPILVGSLYIKKWALPKVPPKTLSLAITFEE